MVQLSGDTQSPANRDQLWSWQSAVHHSGFSASGQFAGAELILLVTTKPLRRRPDRTLFMLLQMSGDVHPNPGPATKYPCPVCARNVTSRGVSYQCNRCSGWVHAKCSGLLNAAQYRRSSDWACGPCSTPPPTPSPPPTPTPPTDQKCDDSTFNVLQLNANGIGNKLTELGVVMEKIKSKWRWYRSQSSHQNPRTPASRITPQSARTVLMARAEDYLSSSIDRWLSPNSHGQQSGYMIPTWNNLPSVEAEIGNTKLIISNIYIPPASSCSNGYHSSIEHLLTTQDSLILVDFNAHHLSWYSGSTDTRWRKMADSINGSDHGILNWDTPTRVPPNAEPEPSSPDVSLASASLISSCSWQTLSTLSSDHLPILIRLQMKTPPNQVYVKPMLT